MNDIVVADKLSPALAAENINKEHALAQQCAETAVQHAVRCGQLLLEVKASLQHGEFMPWVSANCGFSYESAKRYMMVAKESEKGNALPNSLRGLFPSGAAERNAFTGEVEWYTPAEYVEAARKLMGGIDLDPASSDAAQKTIRAKHYFTQNDNGLEKEWTGRVWLNPPYGDTIGPFVSRLVEAVKSKSVTEAVLLTHNSCDTGWWHEAVAASAAVLFTRGRINFQRSDGFTASPPLGQSFFYFGKRPKSFATRFSEFGYVLFNG